MENKEFSYKGAVLNGFFALLLVVVLFAAAIYFFIKADKEAANAIFGVIFMIAFIICVNGFIKLEPNEAVALLFWPPYAGGIILLRCRCVKWLPRGGNCFGAAQAGG